MTTNDLASIPVGSEWLPFGMQSVAILLDVSHDILAVVAFILCLVLFRRHRQTGWLFVSAVFLEPLWILLLHALKGETVDLLQVADAVEWLVECKLQIGFPGILHSFRYRIVYAHAQKRERDCRNISWDTESC